MDILIQISGACFIGLIVGMVSPSAEESEFVLNKYKHSKVIAGLYGKGFSLVRVLVNIPFIILFLAMFVPYVIWLQSPNRYLFPWQTLVAVYIASPFLGFMLRKKVFRSWANKSI